jgi:tetratricopeptide (TPR) repeat protein
VARGGVGRPELAQTAASEAFKQLVSEAEKKNAAGSYAESMRLVMGALGAAPDAEDPLAARAATLYAWGRFHEARDAFGRVVSLHPLNKNGLLFERLGWAAFYCKDIPEAKAWLLRAVNADPGKASCHFGLGVALQAAGEIESALKHYNLALQLGESSTDALIMLGGCKLDLGDAAEAEVIFRRAIARDSEQAGAWTALGVALSRQQRYGEGLDAFKHADELEQTTGEDADNFVNFAANLRDDGRVQEAIELCERYLPRRPATSGHAIYGVALLTRGRLEDGWIHNEFRWLEEPLLGLRPGFGSPAWDGQELDGKTILLRTEQGYGDAIQFIRYAPLLKTLGANVIFQVGEGFADLARGFSGVDQVLAERTATAFDYYAHLLSLPRVFRTGVASTPANVPYLTPSTFHREKWQGRLGTGDKLGVGLVWAGSPRHLRDRQRSMSLETLAPIFGIAGVRFVSLQKGAAGPEFASIPPGTDVIDLGPELQDFSDTAAVIGQLDLVLCVDTAVAHLAGALGKPVWVMLPTPADWRWLEEREDSPWYPTMRLFRQNRRGEWGEVVERVKAALQQRARDGVGAALVSATRRPKVQAAPPVPVIAIPSQAPGHRPGFSAVTEYRYGILQYLPDEARVGDSLAWYGEYLQPQLELLARLLRSGMTMMEVGAGVGAHALFLATILSEKGHLFLYESRPVVKRILQQNLTANRATNVTLMRRTLSAWGEVADRASETLDELQLERLDCIKVNESVSPFDVLEGGADTLWRLRPLLFLAMADAPVLTALASRVKAFSYRCWRMETALFNPRNFNRRDTDIFSGQTALTLLAVPEEVEADVARDHCVELA